MTLLIIALFIATALLSIPIAHALVLASVGGLLIIDKVPVHLAIEQMLSQTQSFPLIAIPFFMMTGAFKHAVISIRDYRNDKKINRPQALPNFATDRLAS